MSKDYQNRGSLPLTADINVTSLVDVAFTLLVIFIITAPIMQGGVEVDLPQGEVAPITGSDPVIVSVAKDGRIYIGDVPVESLEDFEATFPQYVRNRDVSEVFLRGDREVPYGDVAQVMAVMKRLDVAEVGLVMEQEQRRP